jgi:hypothetical protein
MEDTAMGVTEETSQMSFVQRLSGIFFEPSKVFADINRKPSWLGVFVIVSLLSIPFTYTIMTRTDTTAGVRQRLEASGASAQQIEQQMRAMESVTQSPIYKYGFPALAPVGTLVAYLAIAGILLLVFIIMGAPLNFKKSLAVTFWGFFPPGMISMILGLVIMYIKDPATLNPQHLLMSNLGPLVDDKAQPALYSLLSSIDLFTLWSISLLSIGYAAVSARKLTTAKAATGIVVLWAIYVLGKMGYFAFIAK